MREEPKKEQGSICCYQLMDSLRRSRGSLLADLRF